MSASELDHLYRFTVHDLFRFADDSTLFLGAADAEDSRIVPSVAAVEVAGQIVGYVCLTEERMPGPLSCGRRSVVTRSRIDVEALKGADCTLLIRLL